MFTKIAESFKLAAASLFSYSPIHLLDDDFTCDDRHPAIFELAALKQEVSVA